MAVVDHFDILNIAMAKVLKFGLTTPAADQQVLARVTPILQACSEAAAALRQHTRRWGGSLPDGREMSNVLAELVDGDFSMWAESLAKWMFQFSILPSPPTSFANFPLPPPPAFSGVHNFVKEGGAIVQTTEISRATHDGQSTRKRERGGGEEEAVAVAAVRGSAPGCRTATGRATTCRTRAPARSAPTAGSRTTAPSLKPAAVAAADAEGGAADAAGGGTARTVRPPPRWWCVERAGVPDGAGFTTVL